MTVGRFRFVTIPNGTLPCAKLAKLMHTLESSFPDNRLCTLLSIGSVGPDVLDTVFERGMRDVDYIVCLSDRDRLLNSPVPTKLWSDRLTIFNTARQLLPFLHDQPTCFVLGPDARDLRITLALTEIKPDRRGVWVAFVSSPIAPDEEWIALLRELEKRITCVYLIEPAVDEVMPIQPTVSITVVALIHFLESYRAENALFDPWKKSGKLLASQYETAGPDRIDHLITQMPQRLTDELRDLLVTNHALVAVQYNPKQHISVYEFTTLSGALIAPFANEKVNLTITSDRSLVGSTLRAVLILWKPLWLVEA